MRRKDKELSFDVEQLYEGCLIPIKEGETVYLACCDCCETHRIGIKILGNVKGKRKVILNMSRDIEATNELRSQGIEHYEGGYKIKVTKTYNRRY